MLSQTVEYALRAMCHLASAPEDQALNSETIAQRTKVPKGYLSKIMRDLVVAELVQSQRGPAGGFTLARRSDQISILDVISAVDPIKRILKCPLGNPAHLRLCPLHRRLDDSLGLIEREFARTTLADLLDTNIRSAQCRTLVAPTVKGRGSPSP